MQVSGTSTGAEGPAFAAEVPETCIDRLRILGVHRDHRAAGRCVGSFKDPVPGFSAVGGLVDATLLTVAPELARHGDVNGIRICGIDENFRDPLRLFQTHIGPVVAAINRLVDAIAYR